MIIFQLNKRQVIQVVAALRYWGRASETGLTHPKDHPMVKARFTQGGVLPLTLDELETLIGRLDGSLDRRDRRPWNPLRYL